MTIDDIGRKRYFEIQSRARSTGHPTDELLTLYTLEGFLQRLALSPHASQFVLKGGILLAAFQPRRPTRDVDMQALDLDNDAATITDYIKRIATTMLVDGLRFDTSNLRTQVIRDDDEYSGVRVKLSCSLHTAVIPFYIDVSVGDPILPAPQMVSLPRLLGGTIRLQGFPLPMVLAEKLVTAMARGAANTRWRDFLDIYTLTNQDANIFHESEIGVAITTVADHRSVSITPIARLIETYPMAAQAQWDTWLHKQQLTDRAPDPSDFCDPTIIGNNQHRTWNVSKRIWN